MMHWTDFQTGIINNLFINTYVEKALTKFHVICKVLSINSYISDERQYAIMVCGTFIIYMLKMLKI